MTLLLIALPMIGCDESLTTATNDPLPQPGEYYVDIYDAYQAYNGTALFSDSHDHDNLKVVEVNMNGEIIWEFTLPQAWKQN